MRTPKLLGKLISECIATVRDELDEYDADQVLECLEKNHGEVIRDYALTHARALLRILIVSQLKRQVRLEHTDPEPTDQISLPGIDTIPASLSFYDGNRVRYVATMKARPSHWRSAIKLREDAAGFSWEMARRFREILQFLLDRGGEDARLCDVLAKTEGAMEGR